MLLPSVQPASAPCRRCCCCPTQPDMRSGHCAVSAWHQPAGPKNKMFGRGKCILVFSKDLLTKYIVFCSSNLSGYLKHVVEWTGAIWPSSSFPSANVVPRILQAEKLDSCRMNHSEYLLTLMLTLITLMRLFLERSAWNWTIKCVLTTVYWTGPLEQRLTVSKNCNRLPWEI